MDNKEKHTKETEAEIWAIEKMKEQGIEEKADCLCLNGLVTNANTGDIEPCPACEGKGYRDNKEMMIMLYDTGCR